LLLLLFFFFFFSRADAETLSFLTRRWERERDRERDRGERKKESEAAETAHGERAPLEFAEGWIVGDTPAVGV